MQKKNKKIFSCIMALVLTAVLCGLDQAVKLWAQSSLVPGRDREILGSFLVLHLLKNQGGAFSVLEGHRMVLIITAVILICIMTAVFIKIPFDRKYQPLRASIVLVIAGGLGNLIDRLMYGCVIDFIYIRIINFPVFNLADIYITVGVFMMLILLIFVYKED